MEIFRFAGNIIDVLIDNENGYTYPGITERMNELETALNKTNNLNKIQSISIALKALVFLGRCVNKL